MHAFSYIFITPHSDAQRLIRGPGLLLTPDPSLYSNLAQGQHPTASTVHAPKSHLLHHHHRFPAVHKLSVFSKSSLIAHDTSMNDTPLEEGGSTPKWSAKPPHPRLSLMSRPNLNRPCSIAYCTCAGPLLSRHAALSYLAGFERSCILRVGGATMYTRQALHRARFFVPSGCRLVRSC